jgi:hypothetical protein
LRYEAMARLLLELFANQLSFCPNEILIAYSIGFQSLAQVNGLFPADHRALSDCFPAPPKTVTAG